MLGGDFNGFILLKKKHKRVLVLGDLLSLKNAQSRLFLGNYVKNKIKNTLFQQELEFLNP